MLQNSNYRIPEYLQEQVKDTPAIHTVIAGADTEIVLESTRSAAEKGIIEPILIGDPHKITQIAQDIDWDISGFEIIESTDEAHIAVTATCLIREGKAQSLMKGHIHSDTFMRAIVNRETGLRTDRRMSHIFHMTVPDSDKVLYITDGAVNIAPDVKTKIDITRNAIDAAQALGMQRPKVAVLSATEEVTETMPSSVEAREVVEQIQAMNIDVDIAGPLAFDNAVSPEAAAIKKIDGPVAGNADILVMPNIEMGNGIYKAMVYMANATAAGVVVGGTAPIILTSRADPPEARLASVMIAALLGQNK